MVRRRTWALLAAFGATTIYALNHTIAKDVMPTYVQGFGFVMIRLLGATFLFWLIGLFIPKKPIEKKDFLRLLICAFFGMGINMLTFFKGLEYSTPINSAVIITTTPILVFIFSAFLLKEQLIKPRIIGVLIGFLGALLLVIYNNQLHNNAPNIPLGNMLFVINAGSFALYLVFVRPLTQKYHPVQLLKWLFLMGLIFCSPVTWAEFNEVSWTSMPFSALWRMAFVVIGTTFLTYLFNIYALKTLKASTVSVFTYLQPVMGIMFAIIVGADKLSFVGAFSCAAVLFGVYLVTKRYQV
jgi:drug/metabolite transporter (DMT)-like permease